MQPNIMISSPSVCSSAPEGQHDSNHSAPVNAETAGNNSDKGNEKGMTRTRVTHETHAARQVERFKKSVDL